MCFCVSDAPGGSSLLWERGRPGGGRHFETVSLPNEKYVREKVNNVFKALHLLLIVLLFS
jgi:hypothetical protein